MIVADTNLIAYLLIPGTNSALADAVLQKDAEWAIPLLYRSELRNVLSLTMRLQGMTLSQAQQTMARAENLLSAHEYALPSDLILELTSKTKLSAYDAEFVILADQLNIPLVTQDKGILKAAPKIAVDPKTFIQS